MKPCKLFGVIGPRGIIEAALVGLILAGMAAAQAPGGQPPTVVETVAVKTERLADPLEAIGSLRAADAVVIRSEIAGRIAKVHFDDGTRVRAGQLLYTLDDDLARTAAREAQANLALSRKRFARGQELKSRSLLAAADYESLASSVSVDEARLASAQTRVSKSALTAPFAGVAGLSDSSIGAYVQPGEALVEIVRIDPIEVQFEVPEADWAKLAAGQPVDITVDAFPGETFSGEISAVAPRIDDSSRAGRARARLPNPDGKLRPGLFARVAILTRAATARLLVPEEAIVAGPTGFSVFRIKEGQAESVKVRTGLRRPGIVEITSGLDAGDEVVVAGQIKIADGAAVEARRIDKPAPTKASAAEAVTPR